MRSQSSKIAGRQPLAEPEAPYDPGDHTVPEVLAHVEEHPDQADAVREAEANGKARPTLLAQLELR